MQFSDTGMETGAAAATGVVNDKINSEEAIMPLTVKQVSLAVKDDTSFLVNNVRVHSVTVVGQIMSIISKTESATDFLLDDGTASLHVSVFNTCGIASEWSEGKYFRVIGRLEKNPKGEIKMSAFYIKQLKDFNELTYHLLEAIHCHLVAVPSHAPAAAASTSAVADTTGAVASGDWDQSLRETILKVLSADKDGVTYEEMISAIPGVEEDQIVHHFNELVKEEKITWGKDDTRYTSVLG